MFYPIIIAYVSITSCKKSEKIHCIHLLYNFRNSFWATFCPKKSSQSILSLYATVTSCQKIRKVRCIDFSQNLRTSFGTNSGHFNPLSANLTKWSNTLKNWLSVFDHFEGLALKRLTLKHSFSQGNHSVQYYAFILL